VYLPRSALMPLTEKGGTGASARSAGARAGGPLPVSMPGMDPGSTEDNLQVEMPRGPQELATTLNSWTTLHHINWSFDQQRGEIKIFRLVTKTWQLPVKPSPINYTSDFKGPTEQSNNSNALSITTDSPPVKNEASSGLLELDAIQNQVKTVMTQSGSISGNPVMGTLTLTDTADSVERAEKIVDENAGVLNKQVVLRVRMVQVTTSVDNELSFDWSTVLSKAFQNVSGFSLTTTSPLTLAPSTAGSIGLNFTSGSLNGTSAVINALKDLGNVSTSNEIPLSIQNRHSSYYNVRTRFSYVASTTPASSVVGGTGGVPGITTAQDQVGLKMMLYPSVGQNNTVDLTVSIDNSVLQSLQSFTSGSGSNQQTVQLPNITGEGAVTDAIVHNGGTVVLTAFDRDSSTYDKRTLGDYLPVIFGGSKSAQHSRTATLIILSAVVQDMGS
jgi:type IVB pilus formation R64 PilN family outer membrane protein